MKRKAAWYGRMSTDLQDASIEEQRYEAQKLAAQQNCEIVAEYVDEAMQGHNENRPNFRRMLEEVRSGKAKWEILLVWNLDRLTRSNVWEATSYLRILYKAGVTVISKTEGVLSLDPENIGDVLRLIVSAHANEQYCRKLAHNTTRGVLRGLRNGTASGGPVPFGYMKDTDRKLVPNENANGRQMSPADVVRLIYSLFVQHRWAVSAIGRRLRELGIPGPRGGHWMYRAIKWILKNPSYVGYRIWGTCGTGKFVRVVNGEIVENSKGKAEKDWKQGGSFRLDNVIKVPLIDRRTWDAAQEMLNQPKFVIRHDRRSLPLVGIVVCGHCDQALLTNSSYKGKEPKLRYRCCRNDSTHIKFTGHKNYSIPAGWLHNALRDAILDAITEEHINKAVSTEAKRLYEESNTGSKDFAVTEKRAANLRKELKQAEEALFRVCQDEKLKDKAYLFSGKIDELREQLQTAEGELRIVAAKQPMTKEDALREARRRARKALELRVELESEDEERVAEALRRSLKEVRVWTRPKQPEEVGHRRRETLVERMDVLLVGRTDGFETPSDTVSVLRPLDHKLYIFIQRNAITTHS